MPLGFTATSLLEPQTAHSSGELAETQTHISQEDELACTLEVCLSVFPLGLLQDIHIKGLISCEPSLEDNPCSPHITEPCDSKCPVPRISRVDNKDVH